MRWIRLMLCLATVVSFASTAGAQQTDDREAVMTALKEATRLLDRGEVARFLETFVRPSETSELTTRFGSLDKAAEAYKERIPDLLKALQKASALTPSFSRENTRATFALDPPVGRHGRVVMQKIEGRWYLRD